MSRFAKDEVKWKVTLKEEDCSRGSLKTPPVSKPEEGDDPDAAFLEKMYLIELCPSIIDETYRQFLEIRLSPIAWEKEVKEVAHWISHDISQGARYKLNFIGRFSVTKHTDDKLKIAKRVFKQILWMFLVFW